MAEKKWGISLNSRERMELERIVLDQDEAAALKFLEKSVYPHVAELDKSPHGCLHVALDQREADLGIKRSDQSEADED